MESKACSPDVIGRGLFAAINIDPPDVATQFRSLDDTAGDCVCFCVLQSGSVYSVTWIAPSDKTFADKLLFPLLL